MQSSNFSSPCPCGTGQPFDSCCGPLLRGERWAATAEALMRSRYTAYTLRDADHVFRTWHPRTRPADLTLDDDVQWLGLTVLDTADGGPDDETGEVEFEARCSVAGRSETMHERSRFARRAGRWLYLDAL
ncbi:YchJ family protein [Nocardioides sp. Bht2]|uniref:YchJ family protein n=1 Tax=Nocardioides sp. Bht2 TaxID=3392297 RepID=UPI0039B5E99C